MRTAWLQTLACACVALTALAASCQTSKAAPPVHAEVEAASDRILWQVTLVALDKTGFPPGTKMDPAGLVATSGWRTSLAPFKGDGYREQAIVSYERLGGGRYGIDVRVLRERNDALDNPLDPKQAKWVSEADNEGRAEIVMQFIESLLGDDDIEIGKRRSERLRHE